MNRRKPKDAPAIETWRDADLALMEIATIEREMNLCVAALEEKINEARAQEHEQIKPLAVQHKALEAALKKFAVHHKDDLGKRRSRKLTHGIIGWRKGTGKFKTLKGWTWEKVLEKLSRLRMVRFLRVKEEVDKEALEKLYRAGGLSDERLAGFGLQWHVPDEFYYEIRTESDSESA